MESSGYPWQLFCQGFHGDFIQGLVYLVDCRLCVGGETFYHLLYVYLSKLVVTLSVYNLPRDMADYLVEMVVTAFVFYRRQAPGGYDDVRNNGVVWRDLLLHRITPSC
jgi:hypothetical protein